MAYSGPTIAVPDSSPSSVSGHSPRDTPATKLTHLSPHGTVHQPKPACTVHLTNGPPFFHLQQLPSHAGLHGVSPGPAILGQDPFLSEPTKSVEQAQDAKRKLSPTASVFQPRTPSTPVLQVAQQQDAKPAIGGVENAPPAGALANKHSMLTGVITPLPLVMYGQRQPPRTMPGVDAHQKSVELYFVAGPSRYIMVSGLPPQCPRIYLDALLAVPVLAQARIAVSDHIVPLGMVILRYDDERFADMALAKIRSEFPTWTSGFVTPKCWLAFVKAACDPPADEFEGQVLATTSIDTANPSISLSGQESYVISTLHSRLISFGDIKQVTCMFASGTRVTLKVEYFSLADARRCCISVHASPIQGLRLAVGPYGVSAVRNRIDEPQASMHLNAPPAPAQSLQLVRRSDDARLCSPEKTCTIIGNALTRTPRKWMSSTSNSLESPSANHNVVDVDRIRMGQDVRTTIMLRNIPNKVDQPMLKEIVDETSRGRYDFMYLRIDFANNCNVGYAFINFEDSQYIIGFVEAVAGKRWNRFNSDKVAEVSYATIQGKDCLVQKFRNSSVMLEAPLFRPKIFYTGDGPLAGQEEKFPSPDNHSKMRRSLENAEHVGLFAPRVGQRFRDEQRRRRSRYDRGTRLAEIEENGHEEDGRLSSNYLPFHHRAIAYPGFQQPAHAIFQAC